MSVLAIAVSPRSSAPRVRVILAVSTSPAYCIAPHRLCPAPLENGALDSLPEEPHEFVNGQADPDETRPDNPYPAYTPRLLQAVYNYTYVLRDPGAAYHNGRYTVQLLHDSLESLGEKVPVSLKGKVRP